MDLTRLLVYGLEYFGLYYGTYRGKVVSNSDPQNLGRVQVHCPSIHGNEASQAWAWPIPAMGGNKSGFWHMPDVGEWVYVRFDHGRLAHPFWEGGWWGKGDRTDDMVPSKIVLCSKEGMKLVLDRQARSILLQQKAGNSVLLDDTGIAINTTGKVQINAQGEVDIVSPAANITSPTITLTGDVSVIGNLGIAPGASTGNRAVISGDIHIDGTVTSTGEGHFNGHTVSNHTHPGVQTGTSSTGTPVG